MDINMSSYGSSDSSGYLHAARARPPFSRPPASPVPPWCGGGMPPPPSHMPPSPGPPIMPYAGGLVPPARVPHHVARSSGPPPTGPPPPPPPLDTSGSTIGSAGVLRVAVNNYPSLRPPQHHPYLQSLSHSHGFHAGSHPLVVSAGVGSASGPIAWPYRGSCARFHIFCYYFLQIIFIAAAMCGVALVLADAFFRHRWPHVHGLLFIGVLLLFVSAVMLLVLCQRGSGPMAAAAAAPCQGPGAALFRPLAKTSTATAASLRRPAEEIPLTAVLGCASGDNVYVQTGPHVTLPRRLSPSNPLYQRSEYSHPWDHLNDRQMSIGGDLGSNATASNSRGYANAMNRPR